MGLLDFFKKDRRYKNVNVQEFKSYQNANKVQILDVRTPQETAQGKIKGAKSLNFFDAQFQQQLSKLDKNKNYLVYCRSGNRSSKACRMMADMGFQGEIINLKGGYMAWQAHN